MPVTSIPAASPLVEVMFVRTELVLVVLPAMLCIKKASDTPMADEIAGADSVIELFAKTMATILVPAVIPVPVTSIPMVKPLVEVRFVTILALAVVVPVMAPDEKFRITPEPAAVAGAESVIWVPESTD